MGKFSWLLAGFDSAETGSDVSQAGARSGDRKPLRINHLRRFRGIAAAGTLAILAACGGGDPEDQQEHDVKLPPSDLCQQDPRPVQCL